MGVKVSTDAADAIPEVQVDSVSTLVETLIASAYGSSTVFGRIGKASQPTKSPDRRDIFPLPRVIRRLWVDLSRGATGHADLTVEARLGFV